ncbi:MAG: branched-chain amino acid ABC transporter permease, partial [Dehalococcoidia bacterium]|nr:branched-chain amino acid ABC transporter permease [Dehalococcoidia bacterium]
MDPLLYIFDLIVYIGIFGILALSLNLEFGFTGLANFGKVAFFLVGAYTYALLSQIGIPFYLCLIAGALASAVFGLLVSLPALRLRADYLAIVVLTFGEILRLIVKSEDWIAGGDWGISVSRAISLV